MNWTFEKVRRFYLYVGIAIGFGLNSAVKMFLKDMMGLERYLAYVASHWWDLHPVWGIFCILGYLLLIARARR